jgi:hypothetical protein
MKRLCATLCSTVVFSSAGFATDIVKSPPLQPSTPTPSWSETFSTETRYFSWRNNFAPADGSAGAGRGWEVYVPIAAQLTGKPLETLSIDFTARGGWVKAVQSTPGRSGEAQTWTDTVLSGTATYLGWQGIQPFVSVNANLPTGTPALFGPAANARMDPDLVDITTFGEGFNFGPTAGLNFPITGSLLFTTSVGYTWRGRFSQENNSDPADPLLTSSVDPGDTLTVTGAVNYQTGALAIGLTGSLTWETPTGVNDVETFKPGKRYLLALQSAYEWPDKFGTTTLAASTAHSNRNAVLLPGLSGLVSETLNSNSNLYRVGLQHLVPVGDVQIGPTGSFLYRDHNGYNSATLQFVPQKTRWSAGLLAQYTPNPKVTLSARIERVWTRENENPAIDGGKLDDLAGGILPAATVPSISATEWATTIGLNFKL